MEAFVLACARSLRASARKTCFHCFCSNSVNFYRMKINFNVFWEPLKNLKHWSHLCHSDMASFAVAGVFTYVCIFFFISKQEIKTYSIMDLCILINPFSQHLSGIIDWVSDKTCLSSWYIHIKLLWTGLDYFNQKSEMYTSDHLGVQNARTFLETLYSNWHFFFNWGWGGKNGLYKTKL